MTCSVVMTTYNGEKHILEQLESIYLQDRRVDEVLIFDDRSTDSTFEIVSDFIKNRKVGQKWKITRNATQKGFNENFLDGMSEASGDVIFLSDQDDVWELNKVSEIMGGGRKVSTNVGCVQPKNVN